MFSLQEKYCSFLLEIYLWHYIVRLGGNAAGHVLEGTKHSAWILLSLSLWTPKSAGSEHCIYLQTSKVWVEERVPPHHVWMLAVLCSAQETCLLTDPVSTFHSEPYGSISDPLNPQIMKLQGGTMGETERPSLSSKRSQHTHLFFTAQFLYLCVFNLFVFPQTAWFCLFI